MIYFLNGLKVIFILKLDRFFRNLYMLNIFFIILLIENFKNFFIISIV